MKSEKEKARVMYIRLPHWAAQKLEAYGDKYGLSVADLVRAAIYAHYKDLLAEEK